MIRPFQERLWALTAAIEVRQRIARQRTREKSLLFGVRYGSGVSMDYAKLEEVFSLASSEEGRRFYALDHHTARAAEMFGVEYADVTWAQRKTAKLRSFWEMYS